MIKMTAFGEKEPDGRRKVFWLLQGNQWSFTWVHKGWLMPPVAGE